MSKPDRMKMQTYVFRVNIHCEGCNDKVKKLIQKIEGVYNTSIDAEQGKVVVSGTVDPVRIIKKLKNSGKHAELWSGQRPNANNQKDHSPNQSSHFKIGKGKGHKDSKPQQKGGQQQPQLKGGHSAQMHMKGTRYNDLKCPSNDPKSVKFNMQDEEFDASDDDFDCSDDNGEFDDDFDDDDEDDYEHEYSRGHQHHVASKMTSIVGNSYGKKGPTDGMTMHGHPMNGMKRSGREESMNLKKGGAIDLPVKMKGNNGRKNGKNVNEEIKGKGDGEGFECKSKKGGKGKGGGGAKNKNGAKGGGYGLLGFLGFGKKSKNTEGDTKKNNKSNSVGQPVNVMSVAGLTRTKGQEGNKKAGGKFDEFHDVNTRQRTKGAGKFGPMGPSAAQVGGINNFAMGPMANYPMGQMRHGLPAPAPAPAPAHAALNGGYNYQGQPMQPPPSYQQYMPMPIPIPIPMTMPMMMNQQHQPPNGNDMCQSMMYGRPHLHPSLNYMPPQAQPPPMPSHPMNDPVTHIFSDENTESCSIM